MSLNLPVNSRPRQLLLASLAGAMLATRVGHVAGLPDASWAVFFLGGLYFGGWPAFLLLMAEAVGLDWLATQQFGVSAYCISPAYAFLPAAYGALWLGGAAFRRLATGENLRSLVLLAGCLLVAVSACFLLSDGSFYWLGGKVAQTSLAGWAANAARWYPLFLRAACEYVGAAAVLHTLITWLRRARVAGAPLAAR